MTSKRTVAEFAGIILTVAAGFSVFVLPAAATHGGACSHSSADGSIQCAGTNVYAGGTCRPLPEPTCSAPRTVVDCSTWSCACPSGQTYCGTYNTCVTPYSCPFGQSFDACANGGAGACVGSAHVLLSPSSAQSGGISVTGNIASAGGDVYLNNGKAIRVDGTGGTVLNLGNWGGGATGFTLGVYGDMTANTIRLGNSQGVISSNWWEFGPDTNLGVGIDFHANSSPLDFTSRIYRIGGTNSNWQFVNYGSGSIRMGTDNSDDDLIISTGGLVGVGVNPSYKFHVSTSDLTAAAIQSTNTANNSTGLFASTSATGGYAVYGVGGNYGLFGQGNWYGVAGSGFSAGGYFSNANQALSAWTYLAKGTGPTYVGIEAGVSSNICSTAGTFFNSNAGNQTFANFAGCSGGVPYAAVFQGPVKLTTAQLETPAVRVTGGTPGAGKVLTSDASGNGTWQAPGGVWTRSGTTLSTTTAGDAVRVDGDLNVPGGPAAVFTLGDSTSDSVIFNARPASSFVPQSDNAYDLGSSGLRWKTLSLAGDLSMASGKAIRVDGSGVTTLNVGNWGSGATGLNVNVGTSSLATGLKVDGQSTSLTMNRSSNSFMNRFIFSTGGVNDWQVGQLFTAASFVIKRISSPPDVGTTSIYIDGADNIGIGNIQNPSSVLDMYGALTMRESGTPAVSPANQGRIYFDAASDKFKVSQNGGAYVDLVAAAGLGGSGTVGKLPVFTAASTLGDSVITQSGTNIGIGANAPNEKLEVNGNIRQPTGASLVNDYGRAILTTNWTGTHGDFARISSGYDWEGNYANEPFSFTVGTNGFFMEKASTVGTPTGIQLMTVSGTGDVALNNKHAFRSNDTWLRLNQDGAFTSGVHTPGFLNAGSLTVGADYSSPGAGNVRLTGNLVLPATTASTGAIMSGTTRLIHSFGSNSFFAGANAGSLTSSTTANTGIGVNALTATSGNWNTAVGYNAMSGTTTGSANVALGPFNMFQVTSGGFNTAIGYQTFLALTSGSRNTGIGEGAGVNIATGNDNTFLGYNAGVDPGYGALTNATAIGANTRVTASNALILGSGANVGIGTTNPIRALHVNGELSISRSDKVAYINVSDVAGNGGGTIVLRGLTSSGSVETNADVKVVGNLTMSNGTVIDAGGGWHRSYGSTGWYNGTYGGGWFMQDSTWIRSYGSKPVYMDTGFDTGAASGVGCGGGLGNGYTFRVCGWADVTGAMVVQGSGSTSSNYYGYLNSGGAGHVGSMQYFSYSISAWDRMIAPEFDAYSDARIKRVVGLSDPAKDLATLKRLKVTDFRYIDGLNYGDGVKKGFIAQQVEETFPEAVKMTANFIPNVYAMSDRAVFDPGSGTLTVTMKSVPDLAVGDTVRIVAEKDMEKEVVAVRGRSFTVKDWPEDVSRVFVYGKKVDDFRDLDYDRIFTLGVSAVQELSKQVDDLSSENDALRLRLDAIEARLK